MSSEPEVRRYKLPQVPTPVEPQDIANKAYVDNVAGIPSDIVNPQDANLLLYDSVGAVWRNKAMSGDITITKDGVTAIGLLKVLDAMIDSVAVAKITGLQTVIDATPLSDFAVPTADLDINSNKLINVADPTNAQDATTKAYVDALVNVNARQVIFYNSGIGLNASSGAARYIGLLALHSIATVEATAQDPIFGGTLSKLSITVVTNTSSFDVVVVIRINGADGNQTITIPAGVTGIFSDAVNTDVVTRDDLVCLKTSGAGGTGSVTLVGIVSIQIES